MTEFNAEWIEIGNRLRLVLEDQSRKTSPLATKDQAGHADLSITSVYYHPDPVNPEYRNLENDLI